MEKGTQGKTYRIADLSFTGCLRGRSPSEGEVPLSDDFEGAGMGILPPLPGGSSTSTPTSGRAALIPVKVGPSSSGWLLFPLHNIPSCMSLGATVVRNRTPSLN